MDAAFITWVPQRRAQAHRTHQQITGERAARDHMALKPLPPTPYLVAEQPLRPVGKDCLVAFGGNLYSGPAGRGRPCQLVESQATRSQIMLHSTVAASSSETLLATHPRRSAAGSASSKRPTGTHCPPAEDVAPQTGDVLAPAPPRASSGPGGRTSAGPAEPGRGHPRRGRSPAVVGL
ncbi:Mu transposase domain-containing protein [Streptomyces sp. NPDC001665]